jgi:pre-mRNA cleavage complex 2 protein Pcf11
LVKHESIDHSVSAPVPPASGASSIAGPSIASAVPANISSILSSLLKAGVLSSSSTPVGAGATAEARESTPTTDAAKNAAHDYRHAILSVGIKLTGADIVK